MYCTKEIRACMICHRASTALKGYFLKSKVINDTYLLGDILTDRHELDHYQFRNYENLRIPLHSTTHSQLFISYRAMKTWNSLPVELRSASSLSSFRNKLKLMLHQQ